MPVGNKFAESQGLSYVPNDVYLQEGFKGSTPLDFSNLSSSGIMSQAPIPLKYIQEGGGDGLIDTGPTDYGYKSIVDNPNFTPLGQPQTNFEYDIGEGTIDDEDIENNPKGSLGIVDALRAMGAFTIGGPINAGYSLNKSINRNKQKEINKIKAEIDAQYGYGSGAASQKDMDSYGVDKDTDNPKNYDQDYDMKNGGRAGYFFGGRVNYKAGGRIGFAGGGMDMGNEENQAQSASIGDSSAPGPGDTGGEGGNNPNDGSDTQFGGSSNNNDGNNNLTTINKTSIIDKIKNIRYNPIINNPLTRMVGRIGMYSVNPSLMGLDYRTASQLKGVYDKATNGVDDDDVTLSKYKQGGRVSFKNGGLASIL